MLAEARDKLARGVTVRGAVRSPSTVNRYLAALTHAFAVAVREWGWCDDNPLRKVTKPKEPRGRVRYLGDDERGRLLEECRKSESPDIYCAVVLALSTGARRMEILGLRWGQVDFSRRAITLLETKNSEIRSLPLVGHASDLMAERAKVRRIDTDLVFPGRLRGRPVDLRTPFETALKRAGIEDFRWHDLRHSCASYLAKSGVSMLEIAALLGHKSLAMTQRYAHLSETHIAAVVEAMNQKIFS